MKSGCAGLVVGDRPASSFDVMQTRLQAWAAWLTGGSNGAGYPTKSVLHESWLPPTAGQTPNIAVGGCSTRQERELHAIIKGLSVRLQNTLVVVYVLRASTKEQTERLKCQPSTVRARLAEAKTIIARALSAATCD
jgi:hypothetical protein